MQIFRRTGFTLLEVLVALAVIAVALTAVMQNFGQGVDIVVALRERTTALWIAQNRLANHYVAHDWPAADTSEGTTDMAGREWRWREQVTTTPDADVRRVEIEVRVAPGREAAARLVGFLPKP
jgi:general secretion pathway protein I